MAANYSANIFLSDRGIAEDILERLDAVLQQDQGRIEAVCESDAVGMTRAELALTITISFTTSVTANLATPILQQGLEFVKAQVAELIDYEIVRFPDQTVDTPSPKLIRPEDGAEAPDAER